MIIATSISPRHTNYDNQIKAIDSWQRLGKVYSFNSLMEVPQIKPGNFELVQTTKTMQHLTGKPLININAFIDFAILNNDDLLIINSDIIIREIPPFKNDGITLLSRYDYTLDINETNIFSAGFDAFYIPKEFLHIFPVSIYCMGAAWWDYWLPFCCIRNGIPLHYPNGKWLFHQIHKIQYSQEEWYKFGEYFRLDFNFDKKLIVGQIATNSLIKIKSRFI